jgi:hypothetical protein
MHAGTVSLGSQYEDALYGIPRPHCSARMLSPYQLAGSAALLAIARSASPWCFFEDGLHTSGGPHSRTTRRLPLPAHLFAVLTLCIARSWCGEDSSWPAPVPSELREKRPRHTSLVPPELCHAP